jgi:hypothetical protein
VFKSEDRLWAGVYMERSGSTGTSEVLMMGTEMVPEMSVIFNQLALLIAQEDFFNIREVQRRSYLGKIL